MIITLLVVIALIIFAIKFFIEKGRHVPILAFIVIWVFVILGVGFLGIVIFSGKTVTIPAEEKDVKCVETISILKYEVSDANFISCYYMDGQELKIANISQRNSKMLYDPSLSSTYLEIYEITGFKHWWTYIYAFPCGDYCVIRLSHLDTDCSEALNDKDYAIRCLAT